MCVCSVHKADDEQQLGDAVEGEAGRQVVVVVLRTLVPRLRGSGHVLDPLDDLLVGGRGHRAQRLVQVLAAHVGEGPLLPPQRGVLAHLGLGRQLVGLGQQLLQLGQRPLWEEAGREGGDRVERFLVWLRRETNWDFIFFISFFTEMAEVVLDPAPEVPLDEAFDQTPRLLPVAQLRRHPATQTAAFSTKTLLDKLTHPNPQLTPKASTACLRGNCSEPPRIKRSSEQRGRSIGSREDCKNPGVKRKTL